MMREEAFEGGRIGEVGIDREEIVQQRGAGAPMADDEDRRLPSGTASARVGISLRRSNRAREFHGTQRNSSSVSGMQFSVKL